MTQNIEQGQSHLMAHYAQNAFGYPCANSIRYSACLMIILWDMRYILKTGCVVLVIM